jgi:hypothetical protein
MMGYAIYNIYMFEILLIQITAYWIIPARDLILFKIYAQFFILRAGLQPVCCEAKKITLRAGHGQMSVPAGGTNRRGRPVCLP